MTDLNIWAQEGLRVGREGGFHASGGRRLTGERRPCRIARQASDAARCCEANDLARGAVFVRASSAAFMPLRGDGPRTVVQPVLFTRQVRRATAGLAGYSVSYPNDDHHLGRLQVELDTSWSGPLVTVTTTYGLRDWSGSWDDDYSGVIDFVVVADLVDPSATPPRTDLSIVDVEVTQATQAFRDFEILDVNTARPDNSIPLIARKPTALRLYVDYEPISGDPPVTSLSGSIEVTTGSGTTFTVAPAAPIAPRAASLIDRRQASQTLNFVIPESWCQGELQITAVVFDAADPSRPSASFERTLSFLDVAPLRLFAVGVHYTGQDLDLAAPTMNDFVSTMAFVETTYPVGEIDYTGYTTLDYGVDMRANIADGCGSGFNTLLDRLRDMRGDSGDVYYGLLPAGIDSGSVGGCGGGGVAAGFIGDGMTAAQEIGHAFGRHHAPCDNAMRCDNPASTDDSYPDYGTFPSDSIGEIGFDPATNAAFDPATTFDFMGYSGGTLWVSPYTYLGLLDSFRI